MPYPGQSTALGALGYAAFDVNQMVLNLTGFDNVIHHKSNGVVATKCDVTVSNCAMHDIQPDAAYALVGNGAGINCYGPQGWHTLKQAGLGTAAMADPSFEDCYWGIYTRHMNVKSSDNFMDNVGTAYRVEKSGYKEVDIQNNRLDTRRDGIVLNMNDGAAYVLVESNDITFAQDPPPGQYTKGYYGIRVNEANTKNLNSKIQNNTIRYRQGVSTAFGGIGLWSARQYLVANNALHMTNNASNRVGILLQGCDGAEVSCNDINGADNGYPHAGQAGIRNWMGNAPLISCNRIDSTTNGMLFSGWALDADVRGNEMNHHMYGFHLEQFAVIGPQLRRGNLWLESSQVLGAWCETQAGAIQSLITYDPSQPNNVPISYSPSSFFDPEAGATFSCFEGIGECVEFKERCIGCVNEIYYAIADSSLENGVYTDETRWGMKGDLYEVLKTDPALLEVPGMEVFHDAVQITVIGALMEVENERIALFNMDSTEIALLQQNSQQLLALQDELKEALEQRSEPELTDTQKLLLEGEIQGLQHSISEVIAYHTQAIGAAASSRVQSAESVRNINAAIGATELTEFNTKKVNEIYLLTVAKDVSEFSEQQVQELYSIADQCPLVGGNAVFQARSLYYLIDTEQEFDDPSLCLQEGLVTKSLAASANNGFSIVPNPASGMATLVLDTPLDNGGQLVIYSSQGLELLRVRLPADQLRIVLDLSGQAPGVYHFRVRSAQGDEGGVRLIIVR